MGMGIGPKVLWLARMLPLPLRTGDRIYTARLVEALGRSGAQVRYLGLANPEEPTLDASELDPSVQWEIVPGAPRGMARAMLSRRPVVGARFGTPVYRARVRQLLAAERWDAVVLDQYGLAWVLPLIAAVQGKRPAIVHIAHDFETEVTAGIAAAYRGNPVRKLALSLNAGRTAAAERALATGSDLIVTLTGEDAELFRGIGANRANLIVPPGYDGPRMVARTIDAATPRRIGIVGSFDWTAKQINLASFLEAGDAILAEAGVELVVAGQMPPAFRAQWEGLKATKLLGFVDDLPAFLGGCRMGLVIDAVGGGFKLKVLDYVMTRTPVAALRPALGGQAEAMTRHFLIADEAAALARSIVATINDLPRLNAMQDASYAAASTLHDWDNNGRALRSAIEAAMAARA